MSQFRVEVHPDAVAEARAARRWYALRNESAARSFVAALDLAITRVSESPLRWPLFEGDTRRLMLRRFPFAVIYRVRADLILIVAIAHASRRPNYWKQR